MKIREMPGALFRGFGQSSILLAAKRGDLFTNGPRLQTLEVALNSE